MKKSLLSPERKLFWKTAGVALLLLFIIVMIVLFGWSLAQSGEAIH